MSETVTAQVDEAQGQPVLFILQSLHFYQFVSFYIIAPYS